ncbi:GtrA family protein [Xanthomonas campestris]|uniref:GtrA family protein n=1 Tax=Xanthomonas campestris TaxID=339 RepID=UPI000E1FA8EE|nr:GtrA family protein [Xanthomonas campestris]
MMSRQFALFMLAGGTAAIVNFGSRIVLSHWLRYVPAIIVAYCLGMITAFLLNKLFVFDKSDKHLHKQIFWFVLVNIAAVVQTLLISLAFARIIFPYLAIDFRAETLSHGIGVAVPVVTSYIGHKYLSFSQKRT